MPIDLTKSFAMPTGKAKGALPRKTAPGLLAGVPLFRDRIDVIPVSQWGQHYNDNGVKHLVNDILDQNGYGSCASESCTGAVMVMREESGMDFVLLSPLSLYRQVNRGQDAG